MNLEAGLFFSLKNTVEAEKKKNWHGNREVYAYAKTQSFFTWHKQLAIGMTKDLGTRWGASSQWKYVSYEKVELIDLEEYTNILIFYSKVLVIWFILIHIYSFDEMFFSLLLYFWMLHLFFFLFENSNDHLQYWELEKLLWQLCFRFS